MSDAWTPQSPTDVPPPPSPPDAPPPPSSDAPNAAGDSNPLPAPDAGAPPPEATPAPSDAPVPKLGQVVRLKYFDPYAGAGGEETTLTGIVAELVDVDLGDGNTVTRPRVFFFSGTSDPIDPADLET